jgi:hypothetical protein
LYTVVPILDIFKRFRPDMGGYTFKTNPKCPKGYKVKV